MCHPRYCLTLHPGISSNMSNTTHFSMPATPTTLAHVHFTHAGASPMPPMLARHSSTPPTLLMPASQLNGTSPTLARHQRKRTTQVSALPAQVRQPRHSQQHKQHTISQTPGYPVKFLKLLVLKFQEEIQQFLSLIFIFTAFTFQAF